MGKLYSAHAQVALSGGGGATFEAYITAPSTQHLSVKSVIVSGDFNAATDDPVLVEMLRVTSPSSGTTITPSKHDSENSLASQATVHMDSVTATQVANTNVISQQVRPSFAFQPALTIAPSETFGIRMTPGAQNRNINISIYWEE